MDLEFAQKNNEGLDILSKSQDLNVTMHCNT